MSDARGSEHGTDGDRRDAGRRTVMIPATIHCPDGQDFPCVLRDMSQSGAKLSVSRRHRLPESFTLSVPGRNHAYPVRRKWQRADAAGIMLDVPPSEDAPS